MAWKDLVNKALSRTTGHVLTKGTDAGIEAVRAEERRRFEQRAERMRQRHQARLEAQRARLEARFAAKEARRAERAARRRAERAERNAQRRAEARATGENLPWHFDDHTRRTVARVQERTMTSPAKLQGLIEAVRYVETQQIPGTIVECGVWRGGSMQAVAYTLQELGSQTRDLHLYDTYEGMSAPTEADVRVADGRSAAELIEEQPPEGRVHARAGLEDVQEAMAETGYPLDRVHYHQGMVEQTIPDQAPEQIALLRLDTDWYESTKHELIHLYPRLAPGGLLLIDDYGDWEGARKAVLEWLEETGLSLFLAPMGSGRVAVKPR